MHQAARDFVARVLANLPAPPVSVVEIGAYDINGSVRDLFHGGAYTGIDVRPGRGVDVVADGATWRPPEPVDCVVCMEVLEHAHGARFIIANAYRMLKPGGVVIATMAAPPRAPHSAVDGGGLRAGEYYRNIHERLLAHWVRSAGWQGFVIDDDTPGDIYVWAIK
jgi:SAM-dependent methyltransferase